MVGLAPQSIRSVSGVGGFTALVHQQLLGNDRCAQRSVRVDLKEVNGVCNEKAPLGANAIQTSR
jgi:hypothetical protein